MNENNRNFLLAAVLSLAVVFAWQALIIAPRMEAERKAAEIVANQNAALQADAQTGANNNAVSSPTGLPASNASGVAAREPAQSEQVRRIEIVTPKVDGSINLRGARIDDLNLALYRETVDPTSPEIRLLGRNENGNDYFAEFGFSPDSALGTLPGPSTIWEAPANAKLTPETPVILTVTNERGLTFERTIAVDADYMFTITDVVRNTNDTTVALRPYGRLARYGEPETEGIYVIHEGLIGSVGDQGLDEIDYDDLRDDRQIVKEPANEGWVGITDKYWATALIPGQPFTAHYNYYTPSGQAPFYQADYLGQAINVPGNGEVQMVNRLFAGAKKVEVIDGYQDSLNIPLFSNLIDWGWFYFLTKPMFAAMDFINKTVGNFGVTILVITVLIKLVFFPLANLSYASMARMKKVQPQMTEIRERHGDDRAAMQKAMMELYKTEKINPAAGCWPMLLQIPVFFALYKVIYVTIEMRHAPFFGWVNDLSAPDPTSILNLFGLLPYDSPAALAIIAIGVWPLIMGITMFVQMQMNPAPPDPTQAMIFKWMPVLFTFMLATFPVGLVIYWAWNNTLSVLQQGFIMHRQGVKIELWDNLKRMFSRKKADA